MKESEATVSKIIGIDIGGPIIAMGPDWGQVPNQPYDLSNYLETPEVSGSFEAIRQLVEQYGPQNVFLLSVRRADSEPYTLQWLAHYRFFTRTGVRHANVHFCRTRQEKGSKARQLGFWAYVDDKLENLSYMDTVILKILFQGDPDEVAKYQDACPRFYRADSWKEVQDKLLMKGPP